MISDNANWCENLEDRRLLSASPVGLTPQQVRHAYGFDQVTFQNNGQTITGNGAGQTIAIVDAYRDPTIVKDLKIFDQAFGISNTDSKGRFVLTRASPQGTPRVDSGWALETALDVEWAHAIAPKARILLVQAKSDSVDSLLSAVNYARKRTGVTAISMSWGGGEFPYQLAYDQYLASPAGHIGGSGLPGGVTFVTAAGDAGAGASWPASSPGVVAVGGTTLHVGPNGQYQSETAWNGSGGGVSYLEQTAAPDVAYNADPATGFAVYDSTRYFGHTGWQAIGGTSAGAPQWAALVAIANQGRALRGVGSLDGATQTLAALYHAPASDFHDITQGSNGYPAAPGYDLVTGRGSPFADRLISDLVAA